MRWSAEDINNSGIFSGGFIPSNKVGEGKKKKDKVDSTEPF